MCIPSTRVNEMALYWRGYQLVGVWSARALPIWFTKNKNKNAKILLKSLDAFL